MRESRTFIGMLFEEGSQGFPQVISFPDDWKALASIIEAEYIELTRRYIGDTLFTIICDESGLIKERRVTAWGSKKDFIVGSIIVTKLDEEGENYVDLTDEEVGIIRDHIVINTTTQELILMGISFNPAHIHGIPFSKWETAAKIDSQYVNGLRYAAEYGPGLTPDVLNKTLDTIIERGQRNEDP